MLDGVALAAKPGPHLSPLPLALRWSSPSGEYAVNEIVEVCLVLPVSAEHSAQVYRRKDAVEDVGVIKAWFTPLHGTVQHRLDLLAT